MSHAGALGTCWFLTLSLDFTGFHNRAVRNFVCTLFRMA